MNNSTNENSIDYASCRQIAADIMSSDKYNAKQSYTQTEIALLILSGKKPTDFMCFDADPTPEEFDTNQEENKDSTPHTRKFWGQAKSKKTYLDKLKFFNRTGDQSATEGLSQYELYELMCQNTLKYRMDCFKKGSYEVYGDVDGRQYFRQLFTIKKPAFDDGSIRQDTVDYLCYVDVLGFGEKARDLYSTFSRFEGQIWSQISHEGEEAKKKGNNLGDFIIYNQDKALQIRVVSFSDYLQVKTPFCTDFNTFAHKNGGKWRKEDKCWSFPKDKKSAVIEGVRKIYTQDLMKALSKERKKFISGYRGVA